MVDAAGEWIYLPTVRYSYLRQFDWTDESTSPLREGHPTAEIGERKCQNTFFENLFFVNVFSNSYEEQLNATS